MDGVRVDLVLPVHREHKLRNAPVYRAAKLKLGQRELVRVMLGVLDNLTVAVANQADVGISLFNLVQ